MLPNDSKDEYQFIDFASAKAARNGQKPFPEPEESKVHARRRNPENLFNPVEVNATVCDALETVVMVALVLLAGWGIRAFYLWANAQ